MGYLLIPISIQVLESISMKDSFEYLGVFKSKSL
ncbi:MAG: hypothetical protein ACJA1A_002951 [Saprospiraceae bacterium]|jgi:hypothetical protein